MQTMATGEIVRLETDVLVIGAGAAGCRAALAAVDRGAARVTLITKGAFTRSGSSFYPLTHGLGFTSAGSGGSEEAAGVQAHAEQILSAGLGMAGPTLARVLAHDAPRRLAELREQFQLPLMTDSAGEVLWIRPDYGSGSVLACGATIPALQVTFVREVGRRSIQVLEGCTAVRLLGPQGHCAGALFHRAGGELLAIGAGATILATGGYAALFQHGLTSPDQLGAGYALALCQGAELVNMEFYQMILGLTHPLRGMLIAESTLESLPAITNGQGERFLGHYLPADITPAQVLRERAHTGPFHAGRLASYFDLALFGEMRAGRAAPSGGIRCDFTVRKAEELRGFPPDWTHWALERGLDLRQTPVEIAPCVHADNGGILIDPQGATRVAGLFACGEAAGGPHGANRIGGNQMIASQVFGYRAGQAAADWAGGAERRPLSADAGREERAAILQWAGQGGKLSPRLVLARAQEAMTSISVSKSEASLAQVLERLDELVDVQMPGLSVPDSQIGLALELPAALMTARLIARSALFRQESRGPHYREDFPERDDARFGQPLVWRGGIDTSPCATLRRLE